MLTTNSPTARLARHSLRRLRRTWTMVPTLWLATWHGIPQMTISQDIGYLEQFALAEDRHAALQQLIPGTEDYYYFHALQAQSEGKYPQVDEILNRWIQRLGESARTQEVRHRQHLLRYEQRRRDTLNYLRETLQLRFDHQREAVNAADALPPAFNPQLLNRDVLLNQALNQHNLLDGVEDSALEWLGARELSAERRRALLKRLSRPDHAQLAQWIVDDLQVEPRESFGAYPIHLRLTIPQMDECLKLSPDLIHENRFVLAYVAKLAPAEGLEWQHNLAEHARYLDRVWSFVSRLSDQHNSLKAHILYQRLALDLRRDQLDKTRLMTYLRLPRPARYVSQKYLNRPESRQGMANLEERFEGATFYPAITDDESVVRKYMAHFLATAENYREYESLVDSDYLKALFAETKIVRGLGNAEQWASLLTPEQFQALKDRVDLDLAPSNPTVYRRDDAVAIDVDVKNVPTLLVRVYRMNAKNFYQDQNTPISMDIDLDGLVPKDELTLDFTEGPLLQKRRHIDLPMIQEPGIYVVDLIGNGRSSRVLVHKGQLHYVARTTSAGISLTVLNEVNQPVPAAQVWLAGHLYSAETTGEILIPFSTNPGPQSILLIDGPLVTLDALNHEAENYALAAGIVIPRENLVARQVAPLLIRAGLTLNGTPVNLEVLENVTLHITSRDHKGIESTQRIDDIRLKNDQDYAHALRVPPQVASLVVRLTAQVKSLSLGKHVDLSAQQVYHINRIDQTAVIEDVHLARTDRGFHLEVLGKNGEPRRQWPVTITFKHRDFRDQVSTVLPTNAEGRIELGPLSDITHLTAQAARGESQSWPLAEFYRRLPTSLHGTTSDTLEVATGVSDLQVSRDEFALLEKRGDTYVADRFEALKATGSVLIINKLPVGDFELVSKRDGQVTQIRIVEGSHAADFAVGDTRKLELGVQRSLAIESIDTTDKQLVVQLRNANAETRVHVYSSRYASAFPTYSLLGLVRDSDPVLMSRAILPTLYAQGRRLGDEIRYVLERKYARKFPGNMATRPELLLNPWEVQTTNTSIEDLAKGSDFAADAAPAPMAAQDAATAQAVEEGIASFANFDFLERTPYAALNLRPDKDGRIRIDREKLDGALSVQIIAVDITSTAEQTVYLSTKPSATQDLRLAQGLDPSQHLALQKRITLVDSNATFEIPNLGSGRYQMYDSIERMYELYSTLLPNSFLTEFQFLAQWHKLSPQERAEKYSKYACHEVNFFLSRKDPEYFHKVIRPYLANKLHKTFVDNYLLEHDLRSYLNPWDYEQLNVFERILLAERLPDARAGILTELADRVAFTRVPTDQFNVYFGTAVLGQALEEQLADAPARVAGRTSSDAKWSMEFRARGAMGGIADRFEEVEAAADESNTNAPASESDRLDGVARDKRSGAEFSGGEALARRYRLSERKFYQQVDQTQEWAENNYYRRRSADQDSHLVNFNAFWMDWAKHLGSEGQFRSSNALLPVNQPTEAILALALLDLPWESPEHQIDTIDQATRIRSGGPAIVVHEEIRAVDKADGGATVLVSQNFFRHGERHRVVEGETVDNFVTGEFLARQVYGGHVVVTNPTSTLQKLDILIQIPEGALPVQSGQATQSVSLQLAPYHTESIEFFFYFPTAGEFRQFPVHVTHEDSWLAHTEATPFHVVDQPTQIDAKSWDYVSQRGTDEQVVEYLTRENLTQIDLSRIAFRLSNRQVYDQILSALTKRHRYDATLWSYAIHHDDTPRIREFLEHADGFVQQCGYHLDSDLLDILPIERKIHEHLEYHPLINARAHQIGERRQILNDRFHAQYDRWLKVLSYRGTLNDEERLITVTYLVLQDRFTEAIEHFAKIDRSRLSSQLQYDYLHAYLSLTQSNPVQARQIVDQYREYPVTRWRQRFAEIASQVAEIEQGGVGETASTDGTANQDRLAAEQPAIDLQTQGEKIRLDYRNVGQVQVRYYLMDIELMFSRTPFVQRVQGQFSYVTPNIEQTFDLAADQQSVELTLPEAIAHQNVIVEVEAAGIRRTLPFYANNLAVQMLENYGQVHVAHATTKKPLSTVYCKVYALRKDGSVQFYKDGYTDLRGRFDYSSLSTDQLDTVERFAILVLSSEDGATVREVAPPKR